jgi:hypothetical protein
VCVEEAGGDFVPIEYTTFESVHSLSQLANLAPVRMLAGEETLTLRAESWLVNLTKTGIGPFESRET